MEKLEESTRALAQDVLERLKALGASQASVEVSEDEGLSVTWRDGEIEATEYTGERVLSVRVWEKGALGAASTADLSEASVEAVLRGALAIARACEPDPCAGLPDVAALQTRFRELDLWHPHAGGIDSAAHYLSALEEAAYALDGVTGGDGAVYSTSSGAFTLANTEGFCAGYRYSRHDVDCVFTAGEDEAAQTDMAWVAVRDEADLPTPEALGRRAAARAVAKVGARTIKNTVARVLFDAPLACEWLDILEELLSGRALYRKLSFMAGGIGRRWLAPGITVLEEPYRPKAIGSGVFDNEGCAGLERAVVEQGVVTGGFLSSYSARRLGLTTTGNAGGAYNLTMRHEATRPEDDLQTMLARLGTGLYVTDLIGAGVNILTGEYSRAASGFWVENGRIAFPVEGVTIAGNLKTMFERIEHVGADVYDTGARRCGSILVPGLFVGGQT